MSKLPCLALCFAAYASSASPSGTATSAASTSASWGASANSASTAVLRWPRQLPQPRWLRPAPRPRPWRRPRPNARSVRMSAITSSTTWANWRSVTPELSGKCRCTQRRPRLASVAKSPAAWAFASSPRLGAAASPGSGMSFNSSADKMRKTPMFDRPSAAGPWNAGSAAPPPSTTRSRKIRLPRGESARWPRAAPLP